MTTIVFTTFSTHPASQTRSHFLPQPLRKQLPNPLSIFTSNIIKLWPNCLQSESQRPPKNLPKTIENPGLGPKVSQDVSPWSLDHQNVFAGWQNGASRSSKIVVLRWKMIPSSGQPINSHLFSSSTVEQLPDDRGAGGRGKALRFAAPRMGFAGRVRSRVIFYIICILDRPCPCRGPLPKLTPKSFKNWPLNKCAKSPKKWPPRVSDGPPIGRQIRQK